MQTNYLEEKILSEIRWNKVEDIPDFPLKSFEDLQQQIEAKKFNVGIDYGISNRLAEWLYGKRYAISHYLLTWIPFIFAIVSIILALILKNYLLLLGIPFSIIAMITADPINPSRDFMTFIASLSFLLFVYGLWKGNETITYLPLFFVIPFLAIRHLFYRNQNKLIEIALNSEKLFIYLYQNNYLSLKDN